MSCRSCCEHRVAIYVEYPQVSGYPSDGQAANVSLDTTTKEVLEVIGIEKEEAKLQNIDIMFGSVNAIQIAEALEKAGFNIDRKVISIKQSVKEVGNYVAVLKLHKEVSVEVPFEVVAE